MMNWGELGLVIDAGKAMLLQGRVSAIEEAIATYDTAKGVAEQLLSATREAVKATASDARAYCRPQRPARLVYRN